jgi:hypothetical protein
MTEDAPMRVPIVQKGGMFVVGGCGGVWECRVVVNCRVEVLEIELELELRRKMRRSAEVTWSVHGIWI